MLSAFSSSESQPSSADDAGPSALHVLREPDDADGSSAWWSRPPAGLVLSFVGVGAIAAADYLTGVQLSFSIFYLAPILLGARAGGRAAAVVLALLSALVWYLVDSLGGHLYGHWAIPIWNSATRLVLFLGVGMLVLSLRERLDLEHRLSRVDPLTELLNRRAFIDTLRAEVARARRTGRPFALAYLDLDGFKQVNDSLGHDAGDAVLSSVAGQLRTRLRSTDVVARLGGDEFAVLMPETELGAARIVMDEVHTALGGAMHAGGWSVGVSVGLVGSTGPPKLGAGALLSMADTLMYQAKRQGKNNIQQTLLVGHLRPGQG
jgi:diguanylate cyclase (GGDEF)-like protein